MPTHKRGQGKTGRINKPGGGQPTAFKPEFVEQAQKLCHLGATDMEIAHFFGVTWRTIYNWKNTQSAFAAALKEGKEAADARVVRSLYQRAVGYDHDDLKIFMPAGAKKPVMVPFNTHVPPDVAAGMFWLKNRQPDQWRDKNSVVVGGDPDAPIEVGASKLDEFLSRIDGIAAAFGTKGSNEPDDRGSSS